MADTGQTWVTHPCLDFHQFNFPYIQLLRQTYELTFINIKCGGGAKVQEYVFLFSLDALSWIDNISNITFRSASVGGSQVLVSQLVFHERYRGALCCNGGTLQLTAA